VEYRKVSLARSLRCSCAGSDYRKANVNRSFSDSETTTMSIILFLVFGLVVGFLARAIMPGSQKMGLVPTMGLGVLGSFIGGFLVSLVTDNRVTDLNTAGLIGSVVGALVLLLIVGSTFRRRALG
jgi:uncharacterized membrane protein YeaQ/YmgE (transglycosylase-associated protein family)